MSTFRITLDKVPDEVRRRMLGTLRQIAEPGLRSAAELCRAHLARRTPVYTGALKAGWHVRRLSSGQPGWETTNNAPHAGIIEKGARPHAVSREGVEAIARWFQLKVGLTSKEARRAANAFAQKLRKKGQKGTHFIEKALPELERLSRAEVRRFLEAYARGPA